MQDQKGVGSGVSQVAAACCPLWPLNEELCKLTGSAPSLCPWVFPSGLGGDTWPCGPSQVLPVPRMFTPPQSSAIWF